MRKLVDMLRMRNPQIEKVENPTHFSIVLVSVLIFLTYCVLSSLVWLVVSLWFVVMPAYTAWIHGMLHVNLGLRAVLVATFPGCISFLIYSAWKNLRDMFK